MSGRITIDNLSDSLKEMISNSGSGLSEEQVLNLINENGLSDEQVLNLINENGLSEERVISLVKDNLTGDLTQLSTTNKTNIVAAINELFLSANNGKELIASAIGEPLNAEDTFSAMSTGINSLLSTFKTNMMNAGAAIGSGDKFKQLIEKLALLADSGDSGIQYASGSGDWSTTEDITTITINTNLNFTPNIIFCKANSVLFRSGTSKYNTYDSVISNLTKTKFSNKDNYSDFYVTIQNISSDSFDLVCTKPYNDQYTLVNICEWYAIGVGKEDTTLRDSLASILQEEGVSVTEEDDMASLIGKVDEEFDRQVVPQGTATINDVVSGKTFINSTGQLLTGTASKGLATATGTVNVSSTLYTSKSFTINIDFTPTRLILIVPKVWYNGGVIEHENVIVTNETTTLNAGPSENGTIKVSSMTSYSFNIQMKGLQIPECTITWIAIG